MSLQPRIIEQVSFPILFSKRVNHGNMLRQSSKSIPTTRYILFFGLDSTNRTTKQ